MDSIITWQLSRDFIPEESVEELNREVEECKVWLKSEWERGGVIPLEEREVKKEKGKEKGKKAAAGGGGESKEPKNKKRRSQER